MKNTKYSITDIVVAVAAVVGIIATFLPWMSVSVLGVSISAKGSDGDGWITFVLFIAVLGVTIYNMFKEAKWAKIVITILAALAALIALIKVPDALSNGFTLGIGIILVIIAGIVAAVMPWIPMGKKSAKK